MACTAIIIDGHEIDQIVEHDDAGEYVAIVKREVRDLKDMGFGSSIKTRVFDNEMQAYDWLEKRRGY